MAESSSQARPANSSQYHHFVPRFLLRNFAVFKNPGKVVQKTSKKSKNRPPRPQRLNILNLKSGAFEQGDVGDTFGIVDMYRDFEKAGPDQQKLERELSVLESAAGVIIAHVTKMYEAGQKEIQLIRKDKDILRRFLFIMMYRSSSFGQRFAKSKEDYDANDREDMLVYMNEKGFKTPRDVWFANIRAFLDVKLDKEDWMNAMEEFQKLAYPTDARWFFMHIQAYFMAFCTPKRTDDEFLLTQNVYGVYEGPTCNLGPWTDYHRFAPVSSKIMIVLRSTLLPCVGVKDEDDNRQMLLDWNKSMHLNPDKAGSWLEDLPVCKAQNNYSKLVDGRMELLPTKMSRDKHIFYFPFYPLDHEHVQKINMICLENASDTAAMVYKSQASLRIALEFYLTDKTPGFKVTWRPPPTLPGPLQIVFQGGEHAQRLLPYLHLLYNVATQLGSTVELQHNALNPPKTATKPAMDAELRARYGKLGESFQNRTT